MVHQQTFPPSTVQSHQKTLDLINNVSLLRRPMSISRRLVVTCGSLGSGEERSDWRLISAERIVNTGDH
jgi:hypothetical protein